MNVIDWHLSTADLQKMEKAKKLAPDDVDAAVWSLRHAVADLVEYRHTESDRVMDEKRAIHAAFSALKGLVEDIEASQ